MDGFSQRLWDKPVSNRNDLMILFNKIIMEIEKFVEKRGKISNALNK